MKEIYLNILNSNGYHFGADATIEELEEAMVVYYELLNILRGAKISLPPGNDLILSPKA